MPNLRSSPNLSFRLIDGMESITAPIDAPRWVTGGTELYDNPSVVQLEEGVRDLALPLVAAGYSVALLLRYHEDLGAAHGIVRQSDA